MWLEREPYFQSVCHILLALQAQSRGRERLLRALIAAWKGTTVVSQASTHMADMAVAGKSRRLLAEGFGFWHNLCVLRQRQGVAVARFAERAGARRCTAALAEWQSRAQRARLQRGRLEEFMQRCAGVASGEFCRAESDYSIACEDKSCSRHPGR